MRVKSTAVLCTLLACGLLSACSQWRYDLGAPLGDITIPAHNTPLAQALEMLGPPLHISASDTGLVLAWEHWQITEDSVGFRLGVLGADFMSADWGDMRVKGDFLLLTFDKQHMLSSATRSTWDNNAGGGQAVQPLFGFVSVVDVDDLTGVLPQHRWGHSLLESLPGTLNNSSSLDSGQSGLEQRGTPKSAGQKTLEMH